MWLSGGSAMATRCGGTAGAGEIRPLATWPTAGDAGAERLPWAPWGCGAPRGGCDVCCTARDAVGITVRAMGQRLDRSAHVHLKIIKLKYSTDVKHRDIRAKKCIRANDVLNDFDYSDTL